MSTCGRTVWRTKGRIGRKQKKDRKFTRILPSGMGKVHHVAGRVNPANQRAHRTPKSSRRKRAPKNGKGGGLMADHQATLFNDEEGGGCSLGEQKNGEKPNKSS